MHLFRSSEHYKASRLSNCFSYVCCSYTIKRKELTLKKLLILSNLQFRRFGVLTIFSSSFSAMKLIMIDLQNRTNDELLSGSVWFFHVINNIFNWDIMSTFQKSKIKNSLRRVISNIRY